MTNAQMIETAKKYIAENSIELAELTGTEKQIAWASDLRYTAIGAFLQFGSIKMEAFAMFNAKTSAAWWIENDVNVTSAKCMAIALRK